MEDIFLKVTVNNDPKGTFFAKFDHIDRKDATIYAVCANRDQVAFDLVDGHCAGHRVGTIGQCTGTQWKLDAESLKAVQSRCLGTEAMRDIAIASAVRARQANVELRNELAVTKATTIPKPTKPVEATPPSPPKEAQKQYEGDIKVGDVFRPVLGGWATADFGSVDVTVVKRILGTWELFDGNKRRVTVMNATLRDPTVFQFVGHAAPATKAPQETTIDVGSTYELRHDIREVGLSKGTKLVVDVVDTDRNLVTLRTPCRKKGVTTNAYEVRDPSLWKLVEKAAKREPAPIEVGDVYRQSGDVCDWVVDRIDDCKGEIGVLYTLSKRDVLSPKIEWIGTESTLRDLTKWKPVCKPMYREFWEEWSARLAAKHLLHLEESYGKWWQDFASLSIPTHFYCSGIHYL